MYHNLTILNQFHKIILFFEANENFNEIFTNFHKKIMKSTKDKTVF